MMNPGKIGVKRYNGARIFSLSGDVRLTLCISFDNYIEEMFQENEPQQIIFNLVDAESIDSTTLGLMAKTSRLASLHHHPTPIIVSSSPGIDRLLNCMGFDDVFTIVREIDIDCSPDFCLDVCDDDECQTQNKVLMAHKTLMNMNARNAETFRELVVVLESGI